MLRYWDGDAWTDRRRPSLILTTLDLGGMATTGGQPDMPGSRTVGPRVKGPQALEGPVRAAELPAPAAEISSGREGSPGRAGASDQPITARPGGDRRDNEQPLSVGGGRAMPPVPPSNAGQAGSDDPDPGPEPGAAARSRRKWFVLACAAVLATLAVLVAGEAMKPPSPGPRVLTDQQFVKLANAECASSIPQLHPPDRGPFGSAVTPARAASEIRRAADGLDALAGRLATLPAPDADRRHITGWLAGWHTYTGIGRLFATSLVENGATVKAPPYLDRGGRVANTADNFARANGLTNCVFAFVYVGDPSNF